MMRSQLYLVLLLCAAPLMGQQEALKLDDFLTMADHNNPALRQAEAVVRRTEAEARQAALYPNPKIGYEGDQIRGGSYGGGEQGGFVEQTIVLGGKLGLRRDVYLQQKQSDQIASEAQVLRVHSEVTRMFYRAVSDQQMVALRRRQEKLAQDAVETAHQLANVGQADAPDVLQTEVEQEQATLDTANAQRQFIQDFTALATLAGNPNLKTTALEATLETPPEIDAAGIVEKIVSQSPTVREARQQVAMAEARLKQARREVVPDLQLRAGEQQNLEALPEAPGKQTGAQSFASVGVELPLWNRNQGNIQSAEAGVEIARQEVTRTELSLRRQAEELKESYVFARLEADRYRTSLLPRARRAYELSLDKYQKMAQAYPQVLVAQRTLFELEAHYIDALDRSWQTAVALENFNLQ